MRCALRNPGRSTLIAGALVILIAASAASAQSAPPCTTISLSHTSPDVFQPEGTRDVDVHVANEGRSETIVDVRANLGDPWTVEPGNASTTVAAGESETVTFTVTAPAGHAEAANLNLNAQGECSLSGNTFPVDGVALTNEATDSVEVETAEAPAFQLPDLSEIPPEYALGAAGLVVLAGGATFAMRRRTAGFDVKAVEPEKLVRAGRGASFPIELRNRGRDPRTAEFVASDPPSGWSAFMAVPELTLAGGESRTVWLMVRAPRDATPASAAIVTVMVRPKDDEKHASRVAMRAEVQEDAPANGGPEDAGTSPA